MFLLCFFVVYHFLGLFIHTKLTTFIIASLLSALISSYIVYSGWKNYQRSNKDKIVENQRVEESNNTKPFNVRNYLINILRILSIIAILTYFLIPKYFVFVVIVSSLIAFGYYSYNLSEYFSMYKDLFDRYQEEKFFGLYKHWTISGIIRNIFWILLDIYLFIGIFGYLRIINLGIVILLPIFYVIYTIPKPETNFEEMYKRELSLQSKNTKVQVKKKPTITLEERREEFNNILKIFSAALAIFTVVDLFTFITNSNVIPNFVKYGTLLFVTLLSALLFEGAFIKYTKTKVVFAIGFGLSIVIFIILGLVTGYIAKGYHINQTVDSIMFGSTLFTFMLMSFYLATYKNDFS